ncbi:MAG: response regulator [bacterium]
MEIGQKILVIDDDTITCKLLDHILTGTGYAPFCVHNCQQAIEAVQNNFFNLALIDLNLPDIPGIEVMHKIKKLSPDTEAIIITGNASVDTAVRAMQDEAFSYVTKPIDKSYLVALIAKALETQRSQIQHKQAEQERIRLAAAIEQITESIIITDREGTIQYVNPAFENISGYKRNEVMGKLAEIFQDNGNTQLSKAIWDSLNRGMTWNENIIAKKKDGSMYQVDLTVSPVRDSSHAVNNYVAVMRDVTYEVSLERQLRQAQKMEAIGTLADGIADEFNNLLAIIMGNLELVRYDIPAWNPAKQNLEKVLEVCAHAKEAVRQIFIFTRQDNQERKPIHITPIIKDTLKQIEESVPSSIEIKGSLKKSAKVLADPTQIHHMMLNLYTNALWAMRERRGMLEVKLKNAYLDNETISKYPGFKAGQYVQIKVIDNGCGIAPDIIERIFDPYFTTKAVNEGSGMGLAVVHGIVKSHGGVITVHSILGKGTTFTILFPAYL